MQRIIKISSSIGLVILSVFSIIFADRYTVIAQNQVTPTPALASDEIINRRNVIKLRLYTEMVFDEPITALVWLSQNELVVASGNSLIYFYDVSNLDRHHRLITRLKPCDPACITDLIFDDTHNKLIASRRDGTITVWDMATLLETQIIITEASQVYTLANDPLGRFVISGDVNGAVIVWNSPHFENINSFYHSGYIMAVAVNHQGNLITFGGINDANQSLLGITDYENNKLIFLENTQTTGVYSIQFSHDDKRLFVGGGNGLIEVWDMATLTIESNWLSEDAWITDLAISNENDLVFSSSLEGNLRIWYLDGQHDLLFTSSYPIWDVAINDVGTKIASGGDDKTLRIWSVTD